METPDSDVLNVHDENKPPPNRLEYTIEQKSKEIESLQTIINDMINQQNKDAATIDNIDKENNGLREELKSQKETIKLLCEQNKTLSEQHNYYDEKIKLLSAEIDKLKEAKEKES